MSELPSIPERLRFLHQNAYPARRDPWSLHELVDLLAEKDVEIAPDDLESIMRGDYETIPFSVINGLSQVFGVSLDIFGDDPKVWEESASWISMMRTRMDGPSRLAAARNVRRTDKAHRQIRKQWDNR